MSEELNFEFNDYVIAIDEPYENDCGYVAIGKKQSNGINIVFKSPNKGTVNWFIELQKYITDLQSQLDQAKERLKGAIVLPVKIGDTIYVVPSKTNYEINIINRHSELNKVYEYIVSEIRYNKYGYSVVCELDNIPFYFNYEKAKKWCCEHFDTEKFYGETWFATEQEAQVKLRSLKDVYNRT